MSKFTFTYEETPAPGQHSKYTAEFHAVILCDVVSEFEKFLLGLGYVLPKDTHIGYEKDDSEEWPDRKYSEDGTIFDEADKLREDEAFRRHMNESFPF